ncbi:MAG: hypothetical protein NT088_02165 [Candidatus Omnitrophica bacterium]|nr:hypothetical protein [Candidatus Omnitrophota bacterium]
MKRIRLSLIGLIIILSGLSVALAQTAALAQQGASNETATVHHKHKHKNKVNKQAAKDTKKEKEEAGEKVEPKHDK